jgi:glutathione S-transferase
LATRARYAAIVWAVERAAERGEGEAGGLARAIRRDLATPLARLAKGLPALAQIAARRLFAARLGWLEARLGHATHLLGDAPSAADAALLPVLEAYAAGFGDILAPFDPDLEDHPRLAAYLRRAQGDGDSQGEGPPSDPSADRPRKDIP